VSFFSVILIYLAFSFAALSAAFTVLSSLFKDRICFLELFFFLYSFILTINFLLIAFYYRKDESSFDFVTKHSVSAAKSFDYSKLIPE